jgi:hypothetical protein
LAVGSCRNSLKKCIGKTTNTRMKKCIGSGHRFQLYPTQMLGLRIFWFPSCR